MNKPGSLWRCYRFYRAQWEHPGHYSALYEGIHLLDIGRPGVTVAFVPFFPKAPPYWPMGWLPERVDTPANVFEARYFTAYFSDIVITPDDTLANSTLEVEVPNLAEPGAIAPPQKSASKIKLVFVSRHEFARLCEEAEVNLEVFVPANQVVTEKPISGALMNELLALHVPARFRPGFT